MNVLNAYHKTHRKIVSRHVFLHVKVHVHRACIISRAVLGCREPSWPRSRFSSSSKSFVIAPRLGRRGARRRRVWMALPGVALVRAARLRAPRAVAALRAWLVGPALGFGFSVFGVFAALGSRACRTGSPSCLVPALTWAAGVAGAPLRRTDAAACPRSIARDVVAVAIALLIVPLVTWAPYDHVREPVERRRGVPRLLHRRFRLGDDGDGASSRRARCRRSTRSCAARRFTTTGWRIFCRVRCIATCQAWGITAEQVVLIDGLAFGLAFVAFFYALARMAGGEPGVCRRSAWPSGFSPTVTKASNRLWILHQRGRAA